MVKDKCGLIHLTQDQKHLIIYELFVVFEVAAHVLLQLVTDLMAGENRKQFKILLTGQSFPHQSNRIILVFKFFFMFLSLQSAVVTLNQFHDIFVCKTT